MRQSDHDKALDGDESPYVWCLHCERTYERGEFRMVDGLEMCPYADCDGDTVFDAVSWASLRLHHPSYPEKPEPEKVYPAYPNTKG